MNCELETKLLDKWPKILNQKTLIYGIECGNGWFNLINCLCGNLQADTNNNGKPQVVAVQVKEKFGGLRFYTDGGCDRAEGMIWMAEDLSYTICETCGNPGKLYTDAWRITICKDCLNK